MNISSQFVNLNKCCCFLIHFEIVTNIVVTQLINFCSSYNCFRLQANHSWCNSSLYLLNHSWWVLWRRSQRGGDLCCVQDSEIYEWVWVWAFCGYSSNRGKTTVHFAPSCCQIEFQLFVMYLVSYLNFLFCDNNCNMALPIFRLRRNYITIVSIICPESL